ncbi:MAG: SDR family NAD(P)-dependent oxidoreductase [Saprospiraceae bacterium]|nr:SDR family NAD(P)-dependent oxidoreductase [Saprospiraceae bacterium]
MNDTKQYALITGASQGLGKAFAFDLASRRINLLLVALPGEGLPAFAEQLKQHDVEVHHFETDLSLRENLYALADDLNRRFQVFMLVNNAGKGGTTRFEMAPLEYLNGIIELNILATVQLTRLLLPNLKRQGKAFILNVSSMAAFSPIAYKSVYPASKAFIRHFSLGLREELRAFNIVVSVVYPGPMKTNADVTQRIESQGFKGRIGLFSPAAIAKLGIEGLLAGRANIVPGLANQLNRWLMGTLPEAWVIRMVSKAVKKELRNRN